MNTLNESSLSRIIQHIERDTSFAIISAYRKELSEEENRVRHNELRGKIRELKHGYIEQNSGYTDVGTQAIANEMSFFIPNITYREAMKLGADYQQESVLFKDPTRFILVYTKDFTDIDGNSHHIGEIGMDFKFGKSPDGKITFDPAVLKYAFSQLIRANHSQKGIQYAMVSECVSIQERIIPSRTDAMTGHNNGFWLELLPEEENKEINKLLRGYL